MGDVLDELPKRRHTKAKRMLREIVSADSKEDTIMLLKAFENEFLRKHKRAVRCLLKDKNEVFEGCDFPAE